MRETESLRSPEISSRSVTRSTQAAVPPNDETATSGVFFVLVFCIVARLLTAAATAIAAFSMTDLVMRLSETSPIEGYIAMSLSATYHCTAAVPATVLIITLGTR